MKSSNDMKMEVLDQIQQLPSLKDSKLHSKDLVFAQNQQQGSGTKNILILYIRMEYFHNTVSIHIRV